MRISKKELKQIFLEEARKVIKEQMQQRKVFVKSRHAILRDGTTSRHQKIATLKYGTPLVVIGQKGGWLKVMTKNKKIGWIAKARTTTKLRSREERLQMLGRAAANDTGGRVSFTAGARG